MVSTTFKRLLSALVCTSATVSLFLFCYSPQSTQKAKPKVASLSPTNPPQKTLLKKQCTPKKQCPAPAKPYHVIFDLNGVLFRIDKKKALSHLGFTDMLSYTASGNSADDLELKMFDMLHRLNGTTRHTFIVHKNSLIPRHKGNPLPYIMCEWLKGTVSSAAIIERLEPLIQELDKQQYFASNLEKRIIQKIIFLMFDPAIRAQVYLPLKKGINLLNQCREAGNKVHLLSNMDAPLIEELKEIYPDIFNVFDGIIISADVNMIKPYPEIYHHIIKTYNLDPKKCCFIDDQEENIMGAEQAGLKGFHFSEKIARKIRTELVDSGIVT